MAMKAIMVVITAYHIFAVLRRGQKTVWEDFMRGFIICGLAVYWCLL